MTVLQQAREIRKSMDIACIAMDDASALAAMAMYPKWEDLVNEGRAVEKGFRFRYEEKLYRTEQEAYTFVSHYIPGSAGTESLFSRVDEIHTGTIDDPIPFEKNMELYQDSYYTQYNVLYLCIRSSGQPVHDALSALVGLYVEVV